MTLSCTPRSPVPGTVLCAALFAVLGLSPAAAMASAGELRPLSEGEMSSVYGRGLSEVAVGALTTQQQSGSYASASAGDALAAMSAMTSDGTRNLDRQLSQQQVQTATVGVATTIRMAETLATAAQILAPIDTVLPMMPFPLLFSLPTLPSLAAINGKH
jgi:hypothetical protein